MFGHVRFIMIFNNFLLPNQLDLSVGLARLIEILVNWSIYNRKTIIDMKFQKSVTINGCSVQLFN